jgi:hypothetical protein
LLKIVAATILGSYIGMLVAICVVSAYAAMILNPVFNVYYALIMFIVGVAEFYRFSKKNKLEISMDNDFVIQTQSTFQSIWDKKDKDKNPNKPVRHDRFLRGGAEDQPETYTTLN